MSHRTLSLIAGVSYLIIFFAAIFGNFFALESLMIEPMDTINNHPEMVRAGTIAFLIAAVCDVVVAWAFKELYKDNSLTSLSTYFRIMHAGIMGVAVFALPTALKASSSAEVLEQVDTFNDIWLIGLFFFGIHLILLSRIIRVPRFIKFFLLLAGVMYAVDTIAHFTRSDYSDYSDVFLALVAIPSVLGEMSFTLWLLIKGGKRSRQSNKALSSS